MQGRPFISTDGYPPARLAAAAYPCLKRVGLTLGTVWPCRRWGLPCQRRHRRRGALLPHHFTLTPHWFVSCCRARPTHPDHGPNLAGSRRPNTNQCAAVSFLWHFPEDRSRWPLAITSPCPARTFLPSRQGMSDRHTHSGVHLIIPQTARQTSTGWRARITAAYHPW